MIKLIRGMINLPKDFPGCVITIGNFDGVHLGHQALIKKLVQKAREYDLPSVVITFEPQANEFFLQEKAPARLMRLREKMNALSTLGVDYLVCIKFEQALADMSAEDFVQTVVVNQLKCRYIVECTEFRFGAKRLGDVELLQKLGTIYHFDAEGIDPILFEGERVSSTRIRAALHVGDLNLAERLLGKPYVISGKVVHGTKLGRELGFPTANILPHRRVVPVEGIFIVQTRCLGKEVIQGVANIGNRPTLDSSGRMLLEVHLFDFDEDIYGKMIDVEFIKKLRNEEKYDNLELLRLQIIKDVQDAKSYFATSLNR